MRSHSAVILLLLAALALAGCQSAGAPAESAAAPAPEKTDVFEPARGVVCNRGKKVCNWRGGPSVGLTRLFFGNGAADALAPSMAAQNYPYDPIFKPKPTESCDTLVTTCYGVKGVNYDLTEKYFGSKAGKLLEKRSAQILRYGQHVTCDNTSKVCFDRFGAGVGITRLYIDEAASDVLLARLRGKP
ncbi:MAG: YcgJ family protein [Myxococcota bacterium]|jgi:hypothetical protein|nr:hypothetical protein [Deltaproteobacteria bacterium]MCP4240072.1 hypothetical protein [bacterium]MDP6076093.1 YcgJ family protein [Myxococcota bacterium]MDP6243961.1 YcgJ family protein [Myxococcota bacterium]MDP7073559.1 YcgJ family protein [Myxococcota bacterium]